MAIDLSAVIAGLTGGVQAYDAYAQRDREQKRQEEQDALARAMSEAQLEDMKVRRQRNSPEAQLALQEQMNRLMLERERQRIENEERIRGEARKRYPETPTVNPAQAALVQERQMRLAQSKAESAVRAAIPMVEGELARMGYELDPGVKARRVQQVAQQYAPDVPEHMILAAYQRLSAEQNKGGGGAFADAYRKAGIQQ